MQFKNNISFKERYFGSPVLWSACEKLLQLTHDWQPALVSPSHRGEMGQRAEGAELFALGHSSRCGEKGNVDSFNVKLQPLYLEVKRVVISLSKSCINRATPSTDFVSIT